MNNKSKSPPPLPTINAEVNAEVNVWFQTRKIDCDNPSPELLADRRKAGVAPRRRIEELGHKEWVKLYEVCLKDFERGK